jgi:hypothetical protein
MNESAFPWQIDNGETMRGHKGMTLRDYFAAKAMQALLQKYAVDKHKLIADTAYDFADAMMKAREE